MPRGTIQFGHIQSGDVPYASKVEGLSRSAADGIARKKFSCAPFQMDPEMGDRLSTCYSRLYLGHLCGLVEPRHEVVIKPEMPGLRRPASQQDTPFPSKG